MRIVIVEDEVQTREGLSRLIERIDPRYRVVGSAANGQKGLELIYDKRPDVVITDIRMPQMDGLEMIESLARLNVTPKYIVISAFSEFSYARRAMSFGVSEYLLKPISMMELKQAMEMTYAKARGPHEDWPSISDAISLAFNQVMTGSAAPADAAAEAQAAVDSILK